LAKDPTEWFSLRDLKLFFGKNKKRSRLIYAFAFALDAALATMIVRITAIIVTSIA